MKFFVFNQNNSGGSFTLDEINGITHFVIIEANDSDDANKKAQSIGIYFDGCSDGRDCNCCGDRWYEVYGDGHESPSIYGENIENHINSESTIKWMDAGMEVCVHYSDGRKEWF